MLINTIEKTIKKYGLIEKGDRVVVAVSGGPDSTALLLALNGLKLEYGLRLRIAHLDHMFRAAGETKKDREYVSSLSRRLGIPLIFERIDVPAYAKESGLSLEEAAREKRYGFLLKAAKDSGAKKIALGHTMDDQAETVLMRLIRGSGLGGLRGIPPKRPLDGVLIVRPLIEAWRKEVEEYLKGKGVKPRLDATNFMRKFLRNRIRHELIAVLKKYNPNIKEVLVRSAQNFSYDYEALSDAVDRSCKGCLKAKGGFAAVDLRRLKGKQAGIRRGILRKAIEISKGDLRGIDYSHIEDIEDLIKTGKGAIDLPGKMRVVRKKDALIFGKTEAGAVFPKVLKRISVPGSTFIPGLKLTFATKFSGSNVKLGGSKSAEYVDFAKIKGPLYVRTWEKGDRFRPLGMAKEKKLQDFFMDLKVPRGKREGVPLLVSGRDIIWVCGLRLSDAVKIDNGTERVLKISYKTA
ncbi:MAG: tRNA lysidine(34) synthetase TilS [Candidatus Omnitrophica bacterium]|nr:tRNA lysidine(34) synthetase TilS [Candidatus Omnitrophota bacterium]